MKKKRSYKIVTFEERKAIEMMYRGNMSAQEIASKLEISAATVYRELERGNTHIMDKNGRSGYNARLAQQNAERLRKNRGRRRTPSADDESTNNHAFTNRDL